MTRRRWVEHDDLKQPVRPPVSWPVGAERPTTKHGHDDTWRGTGWGLFWGLLFGMLFAVPVVGAAAGAAGGAFAKMRDGLGITDEQLDRIRTSIGSANVRGACSPASSTPTSPRPNAAC